ncbi:hypothetical protein GUJ93_ZPchr0006g43164 [Zizania palustris]|uniref:Uncharacterized protein n=1 Tax=Zizania palustris TaxID=103762 RepID=A0A8J5SM85_ZIZPA|nr:hypothetical protein GUJ93_ZPchr0006g45204 [Zizania palustris]KAG8076018.1 hypothetical protein GUJ93_ZPchr0006g43164 [Zizania palustris]
MARGCTGSAGGRAAARARECAGKRTGGDMGGRAGVRAAARVRGRARREWALGRRVAAQAVRAGVWWRGCADAWAGAKAAARARIGGVGEREERNMKPSFVVDMWGNQE